MKTIAEQILDAEIEQLDKLIEYVGGQKNLADFLDVSKQTVWNWVLRGRISATAALKVEGLTNGKFKASEMRPDVKQWRGK